jgi:hypothetical protein
VKPYSGECSGVNDSVKYKAMLAKDFNIPPKQAHTISIKRFREYQKYCGTKEARLDIWFASQELRWLREQLMDLDLQGDETTED